MQIGMLFIDIFSSEGITDLFEKVYSYKDGKDSPVRLALNPKFLDEVREKAIITPQSLPMICSPLPWGEDQHGGFLSNETDLNSLITGSSQHNHLIALNKNCYDAVNYLNKQPFEINSDLLKFIEEEGQYLINHVFESDRKNFVNLLLSLDVARTYVNQTIYLNVNMDWRGRIYVQSFYINYQGNDISISLLNLSKGQKLTEEGMFYLHIYGANSYNENGISKKSFEERHLWVKNNLDKIYSMDKDFILKADSPFVFTSFCLVMKKLKEDPNYEVKLPVFLDATCSGIQHFCSYGTWFNFS